MGQVVVDGFGDADNTQIVGAPDGFVMDLVGGILGIVAAAIEEIPDVMGLEDGEEPFEILGGLFGVLFEVEFVPAGAQSRGGCILEALDGLGLFVG